MKWCQNERAEIIRTSAHRIIATLVLLQRFASTLSKLKMCCFFTVDIDLRCNCLRMGVVAANTLETIISSPAVVSVDLRENSGTNSHGELVRGFEFLQSYPNLRRCIAARQKIVSVGPKLSCVAVGNSNLVKTVGKKEKSKFNDDIIEPMKIGSKVFINNNGTDEKLPGFDELCALTEKIGSDGKITKKSTIKVNKNYLLRSGFRSYSP